jgi:hypothetical protein
MRKKDKKNKIPENEKRKVKYKKGYFITLIAVVILLILSIFTIQIMTSRQEEYSQLRNQLFAEKASYILDDIRSDIKKVLYVNQPGNSSEITFTENYSYNKSSFLYSEKIYLGMYANNTAANISFDYSLPLGINFTNGMKYETNESSVLNKQIKIYNSSGLNLSNVNLYNITIYSNQTKGSNSSPSFTTSGTYVILNYIDPINAKSFTSQGYVNPSLLNSWIINVPNTASTINISVGLVEGKINALSIKQNNLNAITYAVIKVNMTDKNDLEGRYNILVGLNLTNSEYLNYLKTS